jgi:hypothetical protein
MAKVWVLDTETKGTGANMVPLEKVVRPPSEGERPERPAKRKPAEPKRSAEGGARQRPPAKPAQVERSATPLPPGHVRKKATGEIGKVLAVDSRAGTATVRWLKRGGSSTVPLSSVARR